MNTYVCPKCKSEVIAPVSVPKFEGFCSKCGTRVVHDLKQGTETNIVSPVQYIRDGEKAPEAPVAPAAKQTVLDVSGSGVIPPSAANTPAPAVVVPAPAATNK